MTNSSLDCKNPKDDFYILLMLITILLALLTLCK